MPLGESVAFQNQVQVAVEETRLANSISTEQSGEIEPASGQRFLLVRVSSTNVGDEQVDLASASDFAALLGDDQRSQYEFSSFSRPSRLTEPVSGELYEGQTSAFSNVASSGWFVFEVPMDTEHAVIAWGPSSYEESGQAYWRTRLNPKSLPGVHLVSVDVPDSAVRYEPTDITLTVENSGGAEGTFEATIGEDLYESPIEVNVAVPAGETIQKTVTLPYASEYFGTRDEATISISGEEHTITYTQPRAQLGDSFTAPSGLKVTVYEVEVGSELMTYDGFSEEYTEMRLEDGNRWVFVNLGVVNTGDSSITAPSPLSFSLLDDGAEVGTVAYPSTFGSSREFRGTITDDPYSDPGTLSPGDAASGWVIYEVPIQHRFSALDVQWSAGLEYNGEFDPTVVWEQD